MRIPVFARGANPRVDPPILRKSAAYCDVQVLDGLADWLNPNNHLEGIIARELLPRESEPIFAPEPPSNILPAVELPGVKFEDPETNQQAKAERARLVQAARMVTYFGPDKELAIGA